MSDITIIGTGRMGRAIGGVLRAGGASVEYLDRTGGPVTGDIVILAVPYAAVADIAAARSGELGDRIVVEISNPVERQSLDGLLVGEGSSAAAELAGLLPSSRVLKAFNTNFSPTLASATVGPNRTTVLIAGDDDDAKTSLGAAVTAGGTVDAIDVGPLARAHELECLGFLQISLASQGKIDWSGGFGVVR
jgi:hypothetical protein